MILNFIYLVATVPQGFYHKHHTN